MEELSTKVLVIGGGPAGYVAAIRAGQLGLAAVLVEEAKLGGTCLNIGCIPSKAIIHAAEAFHQTKAHEASSPFGLSTSDTRLDFARTRAWKDAIVGRLNVGVGALLKKSKVRVLQGKADIQDGKTCVVSHAGGLLRIRSEHLVIASGSRPAEIAALPFGGPILSSSEVLALDRVPATLAVVGAGYIGLELGMALAKLGSNVTIIEAAAKILPAWDAELTKPVERRLQALKVRVMANATARGLSADRSALLVDKGDGERASIPAEQILVAVGRKPRIEGFGLERLDLATNGAFIRIDDRCATSMRDVWAIGDVTGEPMLAHRAMAQGEMVAEIIAGKRRIFDPIAIPAICFTDPEIVSVGQSPDQAKAAGTEIVVGSFPFVANGRAMTQDDDAGFVRVAARASDHVVLGIQAVGWGVSELASGFALAIEMGARLEDVAATIHAHPTRGEALQEAAMTALERAIHF
jgi:dihydrolipoamide dehydrogenase